MTDDLMQRLLVLSRWTLERWTRDESWQSGGPGLEPGEDRPVDGFFVTLRKGQDLRGCIGTVEKQESLDATVRQYTVHAAADDPRFPSVEEAELSSIWIGLSLLTPPKRVEDPESIVVGRDGLIIELGSHRGLLLPEVPEEYGWSRTRYLEELCRKAFLPPEAWRDPDSRLQRFESEKISEPSA